MIGSFHHDAFAELIHWLAESKLTVRAQELDQTTGALDASSQELLGRPSHRAAAQTARELKELRAAREAKSPVPVAEQNWDRLWRELRNPEGAVRSLDITRVPADAIAFYRPFHLEPVDQWGIYIVVPRLLGYLDSLRRSLGTLAVFPPPVLGTLVLFDVFNHEFFHHLVECTATTVEILWSARSASPVPVYLPYRLETWQQALGELQHDPLEEALANAYSYNSFSFITRVRGEFLHGAASLYQRALEMSWAHEPPGYREAGSYVKGRQLEGALILVERMVAVRGKPPTLPLAMLVDAVFPKGHAAFWQKPEIPTYLVGSNAELEAFQQLVPAPNESYANLFVADPLEKLDAFIKAQRDKGRAEKKSKKSKKPKM